MSFREQIVGSEIWARTPRVVVLGATGAAVVWKLLLALRPGSANQCAAGGPVQLVDASGEDDLVELARSERATTAVVLVIDVGQPDARRKHIEQAAMFGAMRLVVAVDGMDAVDYSFDAFERAHEAFLRAAEGLALPEVVVVPVASRENELITERSGKVRWYRGPTLLEAFTVTPSAATKSPMARRVASLPRVAALEESLANIAREFQPVALASSLSAEDMVITDAIARLGLPIRAFVIDTGRLHGDTLELLEAIRERYNFEPMIYRPDTEALAEYVATHGRDAFYRSPALRKHCCEIRKVEPLERALKGKRAWITGQRREQAATRTTLAEREFDTVRGIEKFNPLAAWSEGNVWAYLSEHEVPYNRLYDQGYRSIGCAPCTRPVLPIEDIRAGRWWWEAPQSRECGLHVAPPLRAERARSADGAAE